jgi:hypothetical protein
MDMQVNGHAVIAGNPVIPPPPKVLLVATFNGNFVMDTMIPRLRDIGADVVDAVSVKWRGPISREKCSVVAFAFDYCGHADQDWWKSECKKAGVQFLLISRKSANWPLSFRKMGIKLSGVPVTTPLSLPKPQIVTPGPLPPVTPAPPPPPRFAPIILPKAKPTDAALSKPPVTAPVAAAPEKTASKPKFGKTLRACRVEDRSSVGDLADLLGISEGLVYRIEIDDVPVARDIYQRIVELYPKCGEAEPPPFTKGTARNPRVGTRKPVAEPAAPEPTRPIAAPAAVVAPAPAPEYQVLYKALYFQ